MKTILLADDDQYVVEGLMKHIPWDELGVRIVGTASDGKEAYEKFRALKPDIVITDVYMPEMDGFQLTEAILAVDPDVPVIFLSGYDDFANARKAVSFGIQHFLLKPPSLTEIVFVVREVIEALDENRERDELLKKYVSQQHVLRQSMRDAFFRDLLSTRYRPDELPEQRIAFMELPPPDVSIQALSIRLIRSEALNKKKERDWQLLRFGTGNIVREVLARELEAMPNVSAEVVEYTDKEFVVVFLGGDPSAPLSAEAVMNVSTHIVDNVLKFMKISVMGGLGRPYRGYHAVIDSYLDSQVAVEHAEMSEINRIYRFEDVQGSGEGKQASLEWIGKINEAIYQKQPSVVMELWQRFKRQLETETASLPVLRGAYAGVISALWTAWCASSDEGAVDVGLEELLLALHRGESVKQATEWTEEQIGRWLQRMTEPVQGKKSHALVERVIREYVETCYHKTITLEEIAAELHVNRNYLSQLFKRVTGEPFVTYLNKYRVEKAKELIGTGKYMIYEISEMVGFQNSTYFSQVFKSIAGCSPSEYVR